jgi:hypothetical protein
MSSAQHALMIVSGRSVGVVDVGQSRKKTIIYIKNALGTI